MKKGRLILGAAALLATVANAFTFKITRSNHHKLWGTAGTDICFRVNCWTDAIGNGGACRTGDDNITASGVYLTRTAGATCITPVTRYTVIGL